MSIENSSETQSSNGWQNIGICKKYANEKIPRKYRLTYLDIVEKSFGFGNTETNRVKTQLFASSIGMADKSFRTHVNYLEESGHIKVNTHDGYIDGGGSKPNSYSPVFPRGYGKIWLKENAKNNDENRKESSTTERI